MQYTLEEAKQRFQRASDEHAAYRNRCKQWQTQYETGNTGTPHAPKMIYNFTGELINSQISGAVPMPLVTPRRKTPENETRAKVATAMLRHEIERLNKHLIMDAAERITRVSGASLILLEWDPLQTTHGKHGEMTAQVLGPLDFVPQAGVADFEQMDYWFIVREDTRERLAQRYNVDVNDLEGREDDREEKNNEEVVTQVLMMYRAKAGAVGLLSWVGDTVLCDRPHYLRRQSTVCAACGAPLSQGEICACGCENVQVSQRDGEDMTEPLRLLCGRVVPPLQAVHEGEGVVLKARKRPYYKMDIPPLSFRVNTTRENELFGQSDCEAVRSLQTGCNIATDKISEKMAVAGHFTAIPSDLHMEMNNEIGRVLRLQSPSQLDMLKAVQLEYNATFDFSVVDNAYRYAKSVLGITDVFQGKSDTTAKAAAAKEIMVQQAQNVQKAKNLLKEAAFSRLYESMFKMMLAFANEERSYTCHDLQNETLLFSASDFLNYDAETDTLYYEDDFLFSVDNVGTSEHDKPYMMGQIQNDYEMGAYGPPGTPEALFLLWKEREAVGYPRAKEMAAYWQEEQKKTALAPEALGETKMQNIKTKKGEDTNGLPFMQNGNVH